MLCVYMYMYTFSQNKLQYGHPLYIYQLFQPIYPKVLWINSESPSVTILVVSEPFFISARINL